MYNNTPEMLEMAPQKARVSSIPYFNIGHYVRCSWEEAVAGRLTMLGFYVGEKAEFHVRFKVSCAKVLWECSGRIFY